MQDDAAPVVVARAWTDSEALVIKSLEITFCSALTGFQIVPKTI
jgi:hypothetical protein